MYPIELKREAQRLYATGLSCAEISRRINVPAECVRRWVKPEAYEKVISTNRAHRKRRRDKRLATDPLFRKNVAERERMKNPAYRAEKKRQQRERQREKNNTFEAKCHRALVISKRRATLRGYKACSARVSTLMRRYDGLCYVCRQPHENLQVEHCHKTGRFRGWACNRCNALLLRYDDSIRAVRKHIREIPHKLSRFTGVSWDYTHSRWEANIQVKGKRIRLGRFRNELDAAIAYDIAAREHHGERARLNFSIRKAA